MNSKEKSNCNAPSDPGPGGAGEKLVLTELEGRFRDACFCCARWNDVASERSLSPPCEGGAGGVMREPWKAKTVLLASREGCERTERERALGRPCDWSCRDHPPYPPFARGGKGRNEIGMKAQLVQDQLFTSPASVCLHSVPVGCTPPGASSRDDRADRVIVSEQRYSGTLYTEYIGFLC